MTSLFSDLRNLSGTTLMTLLSAIFMSQLIYVIGVGGVQDSELCLGIAFSLHYLHWAVVLWLSALVRETLNSSRQQEWCPRPPAPPPHSRAMCLRFALTSLASWGLPAVATLAALLITDTPNLNPIYKLNCCVRVDPPPLLGTMGQFRGIESLEGKSIGTKFAGLIDLTPWDLAEVKVEDGRWRPPAALPVTSRFCLKQYPANKPSLRLSAHFNQI
ncbi:hypothetical protein AAG570_005390 [Ranatra chinensis]|uniref:Uncharacterized protein n=1 Tax=Ranatra chinensis TaxID=642074 RepID=A0ABD0Y0D8_9HEMI